VIKYLVTTALEETWPEEGENILFLGEWCKLFNRKEKISKYHSHVLPYHWNDREKLKKDYDSILFLYEKNLSILTEKLNEIHHVNFNLRYWRILIGPWLGYFMQVVFDRWFMLNKTIDNNSNLVNLHIPTECNHRYIPNDMSEFIKFSHDDFWNNYLMQSIVQKKFNDKLKIINLQKPFHSKHSPIKPNSRKFKLKRIIHYLVKLNNYLFSCKNNIFLISTYLPSLKVIQLQFKFRQWPQINKISDILNSSFCKEKRSWSLSLNIDYNSRFAEYESLLESLIPANIPLLYLEGYKSNRENVLKSSWSKNPKSIFTSNSYWSSDYFKLWGAEKVINGTSLFIGQHGGNFGMTPFSFHEAHQQEIADKWLSWGWKSDKSSKIIPIGNFKELNRTPKHNPRGYALKVDMSIPRYSGHIMSMPMGGQYLNYLDDQFEFVELLGSRLQSELKVKLGPVDFGWCSDLRWNQKFQNVSVVKKDSMLKLVKGCRVYISTYNATTYLESFTWNIPTIIFWNPDHWELDTIAQEYFEKLKEVSIFHSTPQSAASHLKTIWEDVDGWWFSGEVQSIVSEFCDNYSKITPNTETNLASALLS
jgi:putative transferase (TIGR04331 family)